MARNGSGLRAAHLGRVRTLPIMAALAVLCLLAGTGLITAAPQAAHAATEYPSWDDVQRARQNVANKQAEITRIEGLLRQLASNVEAAQAAAEKAGEEYALADQAFLDAAYKAEQLQKEADEARKTAEQSRLQAGQMAAQLARTGGNDLSANLFVNPGQADSLLERLGYASKLAQQAEALYERAQQDMNTAQSLTDQANVAKEIREELRAEAERKQREAQQKAEAAAAALAEQEEHQVELEAQLAALRSTEARTTEQYQAGVEAERKRREEEERRRLEEERRRWEQQQQQQNSGGSGGTGGQPTSSGWARPSSAYANSSYGYRIHPIYGDRRFHAGTDFAAGCGTPIYAAASGTVSYAGYYGGYGNYVKINHGGVETAYAHIAPGGIRVAYGQFVAVGQVIAVTGTTGDSTGCHLHFEVRVNGYTTDPIEYLRARGVAI